MSGRFVRNTGIFIAFIGFIKINQKTMKKEDDNIVFVLQYSVLGGVTKKILLGC